MTMNVWLRSVLLSAFVPVLLGSAMFVAAISPAAACEFVLGFDALRSLIAEAEGPEKVGDCLGNQRLTADGTVVQQTTGGLMVGGQAGNWSSFTDGYRTWVNGPDGLQQRLNTERFAWEAPSAPATTYRGVPLGGREATEDLRAWIDTYGGLGQGADSYDHWVGQRRAIQEALRRLAEISERDLLEKRQQLIRYIWQADSLPLSKLPSTVERRIDDSRYLGLDNLERIDRLTVTMDYGVNSIAYLFHPQRTNKRLVIYHEGHSGDFIWGRETIQFFISKGYAVLALAMPLLGMNGQPAIADQGYPVSLYEHGSLRLLETGRFSPIQFFVEPVTVALNWANRNFTYESIAMVGISGGGWTTTLYAALDPRVARSYPVAGSLPLELEASGDYEQILPDLYRTADYLELYALGSHGDGRSQIQVLNRYDPCCFSGTDYRLYAEGVQLAVARLGAGSFAVFSDESHREHKISAAALAVMLADLERD